MLVGAYFALLKHDLKGLLAFSTVSHLGLICMLLGIGTQAAVIAALFHIINHALFKAALFMTAGIIDHESGTRDMRKLQGLMSLMPITATLAMIVAASMAGIPPFNGFMSKELFLDQALQQHYSVGCHGLFLFWRLWEPCCRWLTLFALFTMFSLTATVKNCPKNHMILLA